MSTRSQIRFVDPDGNIVAQIYKHSDGYPSNIVPMLGELRDTLQNAGWVRGPTYAAAQFIFLDKLRGLRTCTERLAENLGDVDVDKEREYGLYAQLQEKDGVGPARAEAATAMANLLTDPEQWPEGQTSLYFLGGHGVEDPAANTHGDEEYIYEVTVPGSGRDSSEWSVKASKHKRNGGFESPMWETRSGEMRGYAYDEGETAWDRAEWLYEGSLADAVAVVGAAREHDRDVKEALATGPEEILG